MGSVDSPVLAWGSPHLFLYLIQSDLPHFHLPVSGWVLRLVVAPSCKPQAAESRKGQVSEFFGTVSLKPPVMCGHKYRTRHVHKLHISIFIDRATNSEPDRMKRHMPGVLPKSR
jgi:hypothetical protein